MTRAKVIIISGPPGAGKSTIAKKIAKVFNLPVVSCDPIREFLYDTFGYTDLLTFKRDRKASFGLMFLIIKLLLKSSQSFIIDSAFALSENREKIEKLYKKNKFDCLQINLKAEGIVLWARYQNRILSGKKHPAYLYHFRLNHLRRVARRGFTVPPRINGKILPIDTTNFKKVDYKKITKEVKAFLAA